MDTRRLVDSGDGLPCGSETGDYEFVFLGLRVVWCRSRDGLVGMIARAMRPGRNVHFDFGRVNDLRNVDVSPACPLSHATWLLWCRTASLAQRSSCRSPTPRPQHPPRPSPLLPTSFGPVRRRRHCLHPTKASRGEWEGTWRKVPSSFASPPTRGRPQIAPSSQAPRRAPRPSIAPAWRTVARRSRRRQLQQRGDRRRRMPAWHCDSSGIDCLPAGLIQKTCGDHGGLRFGPGRRRPGSERGHLPPRHRPRSWRRPLPAE